jgi:RNA polymerase sigma-70 factor (ECF subfamily)
MNQSPVASRQASAADAVAPADFQSQLVALIPHMRAFARMLTLDAAEADDLAQDALANAWSARASYTMGTNLKAWAFMILRNRFYSERRRSWRYAPLDPEVAERTLVAGDDPTQALELNELRMAMAALPEDQREAVILIGAGGLSYEEAAAICDCAIGTMKSRVNRARNALREMVETGDFDRDGVLASTSMGAILAEFGRLAGGRLAA